MKKFFTFIFFILIAANSYSTDSKKHDDAFEQKAIKYLESYGVKGSKNNSMNSYSYIQNDQEIPFSVIKKGDMRIRKEVFTSSLACTMGLGDSVAKSVVISHPKLGEEDVLLEEYIHHNYSPNNHSHSAVKDLIGRYEHLGNLSLVNILMDNGNLTKNIQILRENLDVNSVHKFFALVFLTAFFDSKEQNIALRLNKQSKLELVSFDFEDCFHGNWKSFLFVMPFLDTPILPDVKKLIGEWDLQKFEKFKKNIEEFSPKNIRTGFYDFSQHLNRLKNIQEFFKLYPNSTPRDILFFAFFNNHSTASSVLKRLDDASSVRIGYWGNETNDVDVIGTYFKAYDPEYPRGYTGYSDDYSGYAGAIFDYNQNLPANASKTFSGFLNFIPTLGYFHKEKLSEYKGYIKGKFNIDITA